MVLEQGFESWRGQEEVSGAAQGLLVGPLRFSSEHVMCGDRPQEDAAARGAGGL